MAFMGAIITKIIIIVFMLCLTSCGTFRKDCSAFYPEIGQEESLEYRSCRASNGDKEYEFRLAMEAYLIGKYKEARTLFQNAAYDKPDTISIYQPPIGGKKYGSILRIDNGLAEPGHKGAKYMLSEIYRKGNGVRVNVKQADKYLRESMDRKVMIIEKDDHFEIKSNQYLRVMPVTTSSEKYYIDYYNEAVTTGNIKRNIDGFKVMKRDNKDV